LIRKKRDIEADTGKYREDSDYAMSYYDDDCVQGTNSYHDSHKKESLGHSVVAKRFGSEPLKEKLGVW
jgi:hypothetical protein